MSDHEVKWMMWRVEPGQMEDPPSANLIRAIQYFNQKYGSVPNRCELAPNWLEDLSAPAGLTISRTKSVQPGHLMLALDPSIRSRLPGKARAA